MRSPSEISLNPRLDILLAAQRGECTLVHSLLESNADLMNAKTTSKGMSLLHVAAQNGHHELCDQLLELGHETNPVDFDGKTPYQRASSRSVKSLLVTRHTEKLFQEAQCVFGIIQVADLNVHQAHAVLTNDDFIDSPFMSPDMSPDTFAVTALSPPHNKQHQLLTHFRAEALMIPFYGELLVRHEKEQATNFLEMVEQHKLNEISMPFMEVKAYAKSISTLLKNHPQLIGYPRSSDTPDVIHAKKLIIAYGLKGFEIYREQVTPEEWAQLQRLEDVQSVTKLAEKALSIENNAKYGSFREELDELYRIYRSARSNRMR